MNEKEITIDYHQILKWIRTEYRREFYKKYKQIVEDRREQLKKDWSKLSIEDFRKERKSIDEFAEMIKSLV